MGATFLCLSIVLLSLLAGTQPAHTQSADETAVAQMVEALRKAAMTKGRAPFEALTSDHLSYGHSAGRIENKKQFIDAAIASRTLQVHDPRR